MLEAHSKWYKESNIIDLNETPYHLEVISFKGHDGWYGLTDTGTRDSARIPKDITMADLSRKAHLALERNLDLINNLDEQKIVYITHMPAFTENPMYTKYCAASSHLDAITQAANIYCVGHSHQRAEGFTINNCRVYNCGSDYDDPRWVEFEV
jgi:hypothetical protein